MLKYAKVNHHQYFSPWRLDTARSYWLASCQECGVVLNSGHHYPTLELAQAEADRHNEKEHAAA